MRLCRVSARYQARYNSNLDSDLGYPIIYVYAVCNINTCMRYAACGMRHAVCNNMVGYDFSRQRLWFQSIPLNGFFSLCKVSKSNGEVLGLYNDLKGLYFLLEGEEFVV